MNAAGTMQFVPLVLCLDFLFLFLFFFFFFFLLCVDFIAGKSHTSVGAADVVALVDG